MRFTRLNEPPYSPICAGCREPGPDCFFYSPDCPKPREDSDPDEEFNEYPDYDCNTDNI